MHGRHCSLTKGRQRKAVLDPFTGPFLPPSLHPQPAALILSLLYCPAAGWLRKRMCWPAESPHCQAPSREPPAMWWLELSQTSTLPIEEDEKGILLAGCIVAPKKDLGHRGMSENGSTDLYYRCRDRNLLHDLKTQVLLDSSKLFHHFMPLKADLFLKVNLSFLIAHKNKRRGCVFRDLILTLIDTKVVFVSCIRKYKLLFDP